MVAKAARARNVFISHAAGDSDAARAIAERLKDAGFAVWSTEDALLGENVLLELGKALEKADAMVILLSPESARSQNLIFELDYVLGSQRFEGRVIPVLLKETDDIPWILRRLEVMRAGKDASRAGRAIADRLNRMNEVAKQ
jgi:hypothetical protein